MKKLKQAWEWLEGKKTYLSAGAMVLYALLVQGWLNSDWPGAHKLLLEAAALAGLRHAL